MFSIFLDHHGQILWTAVGGVAFAILFFVGGVSRIVEFEGIGLTRTQRMIFIPAHILGCLLFSAVMILITIDPSGHYRKLLNGLFCSGVAILFPIHILVGLKRRIKLKSLTHESIVIQIIPSRR